MAKKPTRTKRRARPVLENPFDSIERYERRKRARDARPWEQNDQSAAGNDDLASLKAYVARLEGKLEAVLSGQGGKGGRKLRRAKPELPLNRLQQLQQEIANIPKVDLDSNPYDPTTQFEQYMQHRDRAQRTAMEAENLKKAKEAEYNQLRQQMPRLLLDQYLENRPELKEKARAVKGIMLTVIEEAAEKGLTPEQYVDSEQFFRDLDEATADLAPKSKKRKANGHSEEDWDDFQEGDEPLEDGDDGDYDDDDEDDDDDGYDADDGRTAGIFGGQESGGKPSRGRGQATENPNEMLEDIKSIQSKLGLF